MFVIFCDLQISFATKETSENVGHPPLLLVEIDLSSLEPVQCSQLKIVPQTEKSTLTSWPLAG